VNVEQAVELGRQAVAMTLVVSAPVMIVAVGVGLLVSILQAVTQLQDQTLSFVPKIVAMFLVLMYLLPWLLTRMMEYSTDLVNAVPGGL
jgi:flagellar biosynthesis protein FliQ